MKIVLVCRVYPTQRSGGMPFVCQDRARALVKLGYEVIVLTTGSSKCENDKGVSVVQVGCEPQEYSSEFAARCVEECKRISPKIIHLDSCDTARPWWKEFDNVSCTLHGFGYGAFLTKWNLYKIGEGPAPSFDAEGMLREREVFKSFRTLLAISKHEYTLLRDVLSIPQTKLVYNPIAEQFFTPTTNPPKSLTLLCASISGQGIRLFNMAKIAANKVGIPLSVISGVSRKEMPSVYDSHSALVTPTAYSQGYDLTVAESLARKRPVILSDIGSYLQEGLSTEGITLFNFGDANDLAEKMRAPLPIVPDSVADKHRPVEHAKNWIAALS